MKFSAIKFRHYSRLPQKVRKKSKLNLIPLFVSIFFLILIYQFYSYVNKPNVIVSPHNVEKAFISLSVGHLSSLRQIPNPVFDNFRIIKTEITINSEDTSTKEIILDFFPFIKNIANFSGNDYVDFRFEYQGKLNDDQFLTLQFPWDICNGEKCDGSPWVIIFSPGDNEVDTDVSYVVGEGLSTQLSLNELPFSHIDLDNTLSISGNQLVKDHGFISFLIPLGQRTTYDLTFSSSYIEFYIVGYKGKTQSGYYLQSLDATPFGRFVPIPPGEITLNLKTRSLIPKQFSTLDKNMTRNGWGYSWSNIKPDNMNIIEFNNVIKEKWIDSSTFFLGVLAGIFIEIFVSIFLKKDFLIQN